MWRSLNTVAGRYEKRVSGRRVYIHFNFGADDYFGELARPKQRYYFDRMIRLKINDNP